MKIGILTQKKYISHHAYLLTNYLMEWMNKVDVRTCHDDGFDWNNYDLVISLLYNKVIKNNEFDLPKFGTINVHPSLLPSHRGSCPNFWAVFTGDGAGWTAHRMTAEIDRGDIYLQQEVPVLLSDTAETLWNRLFDELPSFLNKLAQLISTNTLIPLDVEQYNNKVNTLKEFHQAHSLNTQIGDFDSPELMVAAYYTLNLIQACSFDGYQGAYLDTPDGRVEFMARRIE
jgi:methionyl-tRNA formyltransferase